MPDKADSCHGAADITTKVSLPPENVNCLNGLLATININ